jgi:cytochrome c553
MQKLIALSLLCAAVGGLSLQAADVKENWSKHCTKCHGEDGKGQTTMGKKLKVADYTDANVQAKFKDEEMIKVTKEGKKEGTKTLMKGYADVLSDQEIKDLVAHIRAMAKK